MIYTCSYYDLEKIPSDVLIIDIGGKNDLYCIYNLISLYPPTEWVKDYKWDKKSTLSEKQKLKIFKTRHTKQLKTANIEDIKEFLEKLQNSLPDFDFVLTGYETKNSKLEYSVRKEIINYLNENGLEIKEYVFRYNNEIKLDHIKYFYKPLMKDVSDILIDMIFRGKISFEKVCEILELNASDCFIYLHYGNFDDYEPIKEEMPYEEFISLIRKINKIYYSNEDENNLLLQMLSKSNHLRNSIDLDKVLEEAYSNEPDLYISATKLYEESDKIIKRLLEES